MNKRERVNKEGIPPRDKLRVIPILEPNILETIVRGLSTVFGLLF